VRKTDWRDIAWTVVQFVSAAALFALSIAVRDRFGLGWGVAVFAGLPLLGLSAVFAVAFIAHRRDRRRLIEEEFREPPRGS
jgi:hypothetical protein